MPQSKQKGSQKYLFLIFLSSVDITGTGQLTTMIFFFKNIDEKLNLKIVKIVSNYPLLKEAHARFTTVSFKPSGCPTSNPIVIGQKLRFSRQIGKFKKN